MPGATRPVSCTPTAGGVGFTCGCSTGYAWNTTRCALGKGLQLAESPAFRVSWCVRWRPGIAVVLQLHPE